MKKRNFKPSVRKKYLILISGVIWILIGLLLNHYAFNWLKDNSYENTYIYVISGIVLAIIIHHFGFLKVVDKNLGRIKTLNTETCVFAFMSWKSYLLVAVMMAMGIALRHSMLPRNLLSVIYIGIGLALILSSIRYIRVFLKSE
ncbi:MAG TPA: hypothetical protein VJ877_03905 [Bacteroidales bacterium]|nr:hypothetical protein [Bacteroidales bacterium]